MTYTLRKIVGFFLLAITVGLVSLQLTMTAVWNGLLSIMIAVWDSLLSIF